MTAAVQDQLEEVIAHGNRGHNNKPYRVNELRCADGFTVSVIAGGGTYCTPRPALCSGGHHEGPMPGMYDVGCEYPGPYTEVEVGFPSARPEPWDQWEPLCESPSSPLDTVYVYVPVGLVRDLVAAHGGLA